MGFARLFIVFALSACIQDRCELARERAIACGRGFDDVCDGGLTQRQRCEHRCMTRVQCLDIDLCIVDDCRWPVY